MAIMDAIGCPTNAAPNMGNELTKTNPLAPYKFGPADKRYAVRLSHTRYL
jgi:hypothetical protein